jgi:TPR repeat protein
MSIDIQTLFNVGWMYAQGLNVPQDEEEAARWYRLAADQGNVLAQFNLGWMYSNGRGVPQDAAEAEKWYRLAADQGNVLAQYKIENSVPSDKKAAIFHHLIDRFNHFIDRTVRLNSSVEGA